MEKHILHNFSWGVETPYVAENEIFFRCPKDVVIQDGNIYIDAFSHVSFNTYYNIFPSKQYVKYTNIKDLNIGVVVKGKAKIEVYGIKQELAHSYEVNLLSHYFTNEVNLTIENWSKYDAVYCRLASCEDVVVLKKIFFYTKDEPTQDVKLGCCFCTYNRENYITKNVKKIYEGIVNSQINSLIFISNNGKKINIKNNDIIHLENSDNYGGAGGFTRAALMASEMGCTHIIFMDDDIELNFESVFRTYAFYSFIASKYKNIFLSGSMFSLDEKWLQYERNTIIDNYGMHHQGHCQDLRLYGEILQNATCGLVNGVAGWWFCAFSTQHLKDYGMPLPIFIRGDDIEFSRRCNAKILSLPGICVWHEPFYKKYSEIMEDYYLLRNVLIFSFSTPQNLIEFGMRFFRNKFIRNITTWNYVALKMNMMAIEDFILSRYEANPYENHQRIVNVYNSVKKKSSVEGFVYYENQYTHIRLRKKILLFLLNFILSPSEQGVSQKGFNRRPSDFIRKREVIVYDFHKQCGEKHFFERKHLIFYIMFFIKNYLCIFLQQSKFREQMLQFRKKTTTKEYWNTLLKRKVKI